MPASPRLRALIPAVGLMAGCVTASPGAAQAPTPQDQTYLKYAGPPLDSITYLGHYDGFRALDGQYLVVWTTYRDAYLIKVRDPCNQLPLANRVGLTSSVRTVNRNFDFVLADQQRCRIGTIQRLDVDAMKRDHFGP
jgi:hypothetical protein